MAYVESNGYIGFVGPMSYSATSLAMYKVGRWFHCIFAIMNSFDFNKKGEVIVFIPWREPWIAQSLADDWEECAWTLLSKRGNFMYNAQTLRLHYPMGSPKGERTF